MTESTGWVHRLTERRETRRAPSRSFRFWVPLVLVAIVAAALTYLNRSPWWGWLLVASALGATAAGALWWSRRRALLQVAGWAGCAALVWGVAVVAYPPATPRPAVAEPTARTSPVATEQGPVVGRVAADGRTEVFAGVPYAAPPVGDLRWRPPAPAPERDGTLSADTFSAVPVQAESSFVTRAFTRLVDLPLEETLVNAYPTSEDSLYLNVWRPSEPRRGGPLPVLVYVPGGGFVSGSGALPVYDGAALAARGDVVTVTINYRLGVFGFLADDELSAESEHGASGNYGLMDQVAALQWVQDNIAAFGGDPGRVTVAGESAGAESVCLLGATPLAEDLFHGMIGASNACMGTSGDVDDGDQNDTAEVAARTGARLRTSLGADSVEELRRMPAGRIAAEAEELQAHWRPSVDGYVLPEEPAETYAAGEHHQVPLLAGSNADEMSLFLDAVDPDPATYRDWVRETYGRHADAFLALYPGDTAEDAVTSQLRARTDEKMTYPAHAWSAAVSAGGTPAYRYYFTRTPPEEGLERFGAYHGAELMYAYDNLGADGDADYTTVDRRLRDQMSGYWINFVRTGDPNGPGLPAWPDVADAPDSVMELGDTTGVVDQPHRSEVDFWATYPGPKS